jgi:hypothetical protein
MLSSGIALEISIGFDLSLILSLSAEIPALIFLKALATIITSGSPYTGELPELLNKVG